MPTKKTPDKQIICTRCGKAYSSRTGNFAKCSSPMWVRNDGFITVCNDCLQFLYDDYVQKLGSRDAAVYRLCMKFDVYYTDAVMAMVSQGNKTYTNPFKAYLSKTNLLQINYNSFDDTLEEQERAVVMTVDDINNVEKNGVKISKASYDRWGSGYEATEYSELDAHYKLLTGAVQDWGNALPVLKQLCVLEVLQKRALKDSDYKLYSTLCKQYRDAYKDAGFKVVQNNTEMENQPMGVMAMVVEKICPAEYYKDKSLFADFDSISDYWQRFIVRPFRNLFGGTTDLDPEFSIKNDDSE